MHLSYLALGSNLNGPQNQVQKAINHISQLEGTIIIKQSSLYETEPLLHPDRKDEKQNNYINAVLKIETNLKPKELLVATQNIEQHMGRKSSQLRWAARIIDIDLLSYENLCLTTPDLILPHPEISKRRFVLEPLYEIEPDLILPNGKTIKGYLEQLL